MGGKRTCACCLVLVTLGVLPVRNAGAQGMSNSERGSLQDMLRTVTADVSKHYYDRNLHGVDWRAGVEKAKEEIDREEQLGAGFMDIAAALDALNDSHTFFIPPRPPYTIDYGWQFQMVGDRCLVTHVRPGSDAEAKGIKPGYEVLAINGFRPTRENLWRIEYILRILKPQPDLNITVLDSEGREQQLSAKTRINELIRAENWSQSVADSRRSVEDQRHSIRPQVKEFGSALMIARIPAFDFGEAAARNLIHKANGHEALIIDLRNNPGGRLDALMNLTRGIFDHEVTIGKQVERDTTKPLIAKSAGKGVFAGKLVVLVDANSASAAELFARVVQLEGRGIVMGDRSAGAVEEAVPYMYPIGRLSFGAQVTVADIIMRDGKSLEHSGVVPDRTSLPTPADLASGRDPVTAQAAALLGVRLTAEEAGKLFPYEWPPDIREWDAR